eukprot:364683-Chlamydomonas_euryale.AAC.10
MLLRLCPFSGTSFEGSPTPTSQKESPLFWPAYRRLAPSLPPPHSSSLPLPCPPFPVPSRPVLFPVRSPVHPFPSSSRHGSGRDVKGLGLRFEGCIVYHNYYHYACVAAGGGGDAPHGAGRAVDGTCHERRRGARLAPRLPQPGAQAGACGRGQAADEGRGSCWWGRCQAADERHG